MHALVHRSAVLVKNRFSKHAAMLNDVVESCNTYVTKDSGDILKIKLKVSEEVLS